MYKLYTDKIENFEAKIKLEGASLKKSKARLVIEADGFDVMFKGTISDTGNVKAIAVDDLKLNNVDFIKIDVDGPDRLVLKGCLNTIKKCNPVIYIEYGTEQLDWEKRYNNTILNKSEDLWSILKPQYKEYVGLENNIVLVPIEK